MTPVIIWWHPWWPVPLLILAAFYLPKVYRMLRSKR